MQRIVLCEDQPAYRAYLQDVLGEIALREDTAVRPQLLHLKQGLQQPLEEEHAQLLQEFRKQRWNLRQELLEHLHDKAVAHQASVRYHSISFLKQQKWELILISRLVLLRTKD